MEVVLVLIVCWKKNRKNIDIFNGFYDISGIVIGLLFIECPNEKGLTIISTNQVAGLKYE
jgi:hypothetical protein